MEILIPLHYERHVLRRPYAEWPEPVNRSFAHINADLYNLMQGPSELGASGRLADWDRFDDLKEITTPALVIGARYDTMDPAHMEAMSRDSCLPAGISACPRAATWQCTMTRSATSTASSRSCEASVSHARDHCCVLNRTH